MPTVQWTTPAPLWPAYSNDAAQNGAAPFRQPTILRFANDDFMAEFLNLVANNPSRLADWQVSPETWRGPGATAESVAEIPPFVQKLRRLRQLTAPDEIRPTVDYTQSADDPLKLYQPAHLRYYLITACLVCRIPGLPDRHFDLGNQERVSYVIRKLRPKDPAKPPNFYNLDTCDEYAFVNSPQGAHWQEVSANTLAPGEEHLPLFGVSYDEQNQHSRRLLAAMIPVDKRETYMGTPVSDANAANENTNGAAPGGEKQARLALFTSVVTAPWRELIKSQEKIDEIQEKIDKVQEVIDGPQTFPYIIDGQLLTEEESGNYIADATKLNLELVSHIQALSWYTLLDLAEYLEDQLRPVWQKIQGESPQLTSEQMALYTRLGEVKSYSYSLRQALKKIVRFKDDLESTSEIYRLQTFSPPPPWPDFLFSLTSPDLQSLLNGSSEEASLETLLENALPSTPAAPVTPAPLAAQLSAAAKAGQFNANEPGWFVIRCVFERPNCGPTVTPVMSDPTVPFQMAGFFDPDAPARPIRIALPLDTTPAGLRKFDKNTAFMISDVLCGQMERLGDITFGDLVLSVLPWPFHKDLPAGDAAPCAEGGTNIGMICSLSIPIVTICALILLMIIVSLLDQIFHWIPFFISCFPLPGFLAKEDD